EPRTLSRTIHLEGASRTVQTTIMAPQTMTMEENYTTCILVPEERTIEHSIAVQKMICEAPMMDEFATVRPRVVMLSARGLNELGSWHPEGGRIPSSTYF